MPKRESLHLGILGSVATPILVLIVLFSFESLGALAGILFFPFAFFAAYVFQAVTPSVWLLAILQFPAYGFSLDFLWDRKNLRAYAVSLLVAHTAAVTICLVLAYGLNS